MRSISPGDVWLPDVVEDPTIHLSCPMGRNERPPGTGRSRHRDPAGRRCGCCASPSPNAPLRFACPTRSPAHSNESPQETSDALHHAAQQPEDAGQEATYRTAQTAKNSHLSLLSCGEVPVPRTADRTLRRRIVGERSSHLAVGGPRSLAMRPPGGLGCFSTPPRLQGLAGSAAAGSGGRLGAARPRTGRGRADGPSGCVTLCLRADRRG